MVRLKVLSLLKAQVFPQNAKSAFLEESYSRLISENAALCCVIFHWSCVQERSVLIQPRINFVMHHQNEHILDSTSGISVYKYAKFDNIDLIISGSFHLITGFTHAIQIRHYWRQQCLGSSVMVTAHLV